MELIPLNYGYKAELIKKLERAFEVAKTTLPMDVLEEYYSRNLFTATVALLANVNNGHLLPVFRANIPTELLSWAQKIYKKVHNRFARKRHEHAMVYWRG